MKRKGDHARWFTVQDLAVRLHLKPKTVRRIVRPYRDRCHLARNGSHPRKVLWVPLEVVRAIEKAREALFAKSLSRPSSPSPLT
jgi:hypothetical protein